MMTREIQTAFAVYCLTACALVSLCPRVWGAHVQAPGNLRVLSVEQQKQQVAGGDEDLVTVTVHYTSSRQPQLEWTRAGPRGETVVIPEASQSYRGNAGTSSVTVSRYGQYFIFLKIGFFDVQYLDIFIKPFSISGADKTQDLHTLMTQVETGYDVVYTPGEPFSVEATVPKHIANNFTWTDEEMRPGELALRLDACYEDLATGTVEDSVSNMDDPDMSSFLQSSRTLAEDSARWTLDFNVAGPGISGYFQLFSMYQHPSSEIDETSDDIFEWEKQFVTRIWETVNIQVHQSPDAGPFPSGFAYVRTGYNPKYCSQGGRCFVYCYGYGNNIQEATITKEGAAEPLQEGMSVTHRTSHHVVFSARFKAEGDFAGVYTCRIVTQDNTSAQGSVLVVENR